MLKELYKLESNIKSGHYVFSIFIRKD